MENRQSLFIITILIFLLSLIFSNSSMAIRDQALTGRWKPIANLTDPMVLDIGKFAVEEHNNQYEDSLKFAKVVSGESQVVTGLDYNLTITATDGSVENNYVAIVWDKPWVNFRQLLSFKGPI